MASTEGALAPPATGDRLHALDLALAAALVVGYVGCLLATVEELGYARDEGFYFHAAASYEQWIDLLLQAPGRAMTRAAVDRHWAVNHEHPALMKTLFAMSHRTFFDRWGWFAEAGTAYRFPGMVASALAVGLVFVWGRLAVGRRAGLVAALLFALMPRVFYHAHLACFDLPAVALALASSFALWRSLEHPSLGGGLATGLVYGLYLDTKHNAWLFPAIVLAMTALVAFDWFRSPVRPRRPPTPWGLVAILTVSPAVLYVGWPWLWFDTWARVIEWGRFHLQHDYYNMEFLGVTYWKPPMPRLYAWLMTVATVPGITLLLAVLGLGAGIRRELGERWRWLAERLPRGALAGGPIAGRTTVALWLMSILVVYAPWWSTNTPIFGGTKHWMTAYPFLCLFAGAGFEVVARQLDAALASLPVRAWVRSALPLGAGSAVIAAPLAMTSGAHPWGLSSYTPLVGGAVGAATIGLNRTFWGYSTGAVQDDVNVLAPPEARVYLHDTAQPSFAMMRRDGRLRPDLRDTLDIARSEIALYHHEPHMSRVEHQIWVIYGTASPAVVGTHDGVPIVWVYARPE